MKNTKDYTLLTLAIPFVIAFISCLPRYYEEEKEKPKAEKITILEIGEKDEDGLQWVRYQYPNGEIYSLDMVTDRGIEAVRRGDILEAYNDQDIVISIEVIGGYALHTGVFPKKSQFTPTLPLFLKYYNNNIYKGIWWSLDSLNPAIICVHLRDGRDTILPIPYKPYGPAPLNTKTYQND